MEILGRLCTRCEADRLPGNPVSKSDPFCRGHQSPSHVSNYGYVVGTCDSICGESGENSGHWIGRMSFGYSKNTDGSSCSGMCHHGPPAGPELWTTLGQNKSGQHFTWPAFRHHGYRVMVLESKVVGGAGTNYRFA